METVQTKLFNWYISNQDFLVGKYNGKYLVLTEQGVWKAFQTYIEAYYSAEQHIGLGKFIIQLCTPGKDAYTINMYSPNYAI